jgi:hypothetical protein
MPPGGGCELHDLLGLREVGDMEVDLGGRALAGDLGEPFAGTAGQQQAGALASQRNGDGPADAGRSSREQNALTLEVQTFADPGGRRP